MTEIFGVQITSPEKVLFKNGITKLDVAKYYEKVAPLMLPYVKGRPLSVFRVHENIENGGFFKKHPSTEGEISKIKIDGEDFFTINSEKDIITQVQMGTIEFHPWGCKNRNIERPDVMIFDFDPAPNVDIFSLRESVKLFKGILDELHLESALKTSGGKGYHILIPFKNRLNWQDFEDFSQNLSLLAQEKWPERFTTDIRKNAREGKIFVDYLRNSRGASCASAYSLRAREGAPLSFPIEWSELDKFLPNEVNLKNFSKFYQKTQKNDEKC